MKSFLDPALQRTLLVSLLLIIPASMPSALAQGQGKEEGIAFAVFIQSLAARNIARVCAPGIPGYPERFDSLYRRWSAHHAERIARGEAVFRAALVDPGTPGPNRAKFQQIEKIRKELATGAPPAAPVAINDRMKTVCEDMLADLEKSM